MASLIAVTHIITIRGTELSPGFTPPKIGKIFKTNAVNAPDFHMKKEEGEEGGLGECTRRLTTKITTKRKKMFAIF